MSLMEYRRRHISGDAMVGVGQKAQYLTLLIILQWEALLRMIDSTPHLIRWAWFPSPRASLVMNKEIG